MLKSNSGSCTCIPSSRIPTGGWYRFRAASSRPRCALNPRLTISANLSYALGQVGGLAASSAVFQSRLESELRARLHAPNCENVRYPLSSTISAWPDVRTDSLYNKSANPQNWSLIFRPTFSGLRETLTLRAWSLSSCSRRAPPFSLILRVYQWVVRFSRRTVLTERHKI